MILELIDEAVKKGVRQQEACRILEVNERCPQRWRNNPLDRRTIIKKNPKNKLSEEEEKEIIRISTLPEYRNLSPNEIVPRLADEGTYLASESTFFRVLRKHKMLKNRGRAKSPSSRKPPKAFTATGPNQVWSWDITYLKTLVKGQFYYLYLIMDVWSRKIVGFKVHEEESADLSSALFEKIAKRDKIPTRGLVLHSDNGAPMKGATMVATLEKLGVLPSFSRARVSDDNPYSEALFRTMKYCQEYPSKPFKSLADARSWVAQFVHWYNEIHHHSGIHFVTPNERHTGRDVEKLAKRKKIYEAAKRANPRRWSGKTRNWEHQAEVTLNHPRPPAKIVKEKDLKPFPVAANQTSEELAA